ncbi:MAG: UDP-N-acetylenolpyruvoylglucosamine reductase, partial [Candidatus Omnitrophica bacterium]|nr:UDP-N-acetylenolpyruvoylglucosamine reductase [Candidatus Omnitrophota bacterium]
NKGEAKAGQVLELLNLAQEKVWEKFKIKLELEIEIV